MSVSTRWAWWRQLGVRRAQGAGSAWAGPPWEVAMLLGNKANVAPRGGYGNQGEVEGLPVPLWKVWASVQIPPPLLPRFLTLGKLINPLRLTFRICKVGVIITSTAGTSVRMNESNHVKHSVSFQGTSLPFWVLCRSLCPWPIFHSPLCLTVTL